MSRMSSTYARASVQTHATYGHAATVPYTTIAGAAERKKRSASSNGGRGNPGGSLKARRESIAHSMAEAGIGFAGFTESDQAKTRAGVGGKTGCAHKMQYTGTYTVDKHRPGFLALYGEAPLGYEWAICADRECDWYALRCIDPEAAASSVTPVKDQDGHKWYTVRQVCTLFGWVSDTSHEARVGKLCRSGKLAARRLGKGQWGIWLILAESVLAYVDELGGEVA